MSDHILKTIEDAQMDLRKHEQAVVEAKRFINKLCEFGKMQPLYPEAEGEKPLGSAAPATVRRNSFYGKPLATCVREILEMRKRGGSGAGEATLEEIMTSLRAGNYDLDTISRDKDDQKRGVAISLAKNTSTFHRLPNGDFGLLEWYPSVKKPRGEKGGNGKPAETPAVPTTVETPETPPVEQEAEAASTDTKEPTIE